MLPNGSLATVHQSEDKAHEEQLAMLILTKMGERPLHPSFGLTDPEFTGVEPTEVAAQVSQYGPPVNIEQVEINFTENGVQEVNVLWTPLERIDA